MLGLTTDFSIFWKTTILSFRPKLTFWILNLKIRPVEYVHMDHTDHLGFQYKIDFDLQISINHTIVRKKWLFPKKLDFDGKYYVKNSFLLKT